MNIFQRAIKSVLGAPSSMFSLPWATSSSQLSRTQLIGEYKRYLYTIVSAIAEDFAKIDFSVERATLDSKVPIKNHAFATLIKKPNEDQSQFQFLELHQTYMELAGESFWYMPPTALTRKPTELYLIKPDRIDVVVPDSKDNPFGIVGGYVYTNGKGEKIPFDKDEILHFKMPNPVNPYRGMGTVEAATIYIQTEAYASEWTKQSLYNSGRPSGIINIKGTMDKDDFEQLKKKFRQEYQGSANAGKTMMIPNAEGVEFTKIGMEMGETALTELKNMTRDDLMIMFRVSKTILGITDDVNRANAKEARAVWLQNVIQPKMDRLIDHLNAFLMDRWGGTDVLSYKDPSPEIVEDKLAEWEKGHNKWLTANEIREERNSVLGSSELEPKEGGDELYAPALLVPLADLNTPDEPEPDKGPPKKEPPPEPPPEPPKEGLKKKALPREEAGEIFRQGVFKKQSLWEKRYHKLLRKLFGEQEKEILGRKGITAKAYEDWLFDTKNALKRFSAILVPLSYEMMKDQGESALDFAGDSETEFEINERVKRYVDGRVAHFAEGTNAETIKLLQGSIGEGIQAGESIQKLKNRVKEIYAEAKGARAERIARTETIAASNEAALEAYRQSPEVAAQEWFAEPDACEFCAEFGGKIIGLESSFANVGEPVEGAEGGIFEVDYEDVEHPPLHPNCRCVILPVSSYDFTKARALVLKAEYDRSKNKKSKKAKKLLSDINILKKHQVIR